MNMSITTTGYIKNNKLINQMICWNILLGSNGSETLVLFQGFYE